MVPHIVAGMRLLDVLPLLEADHRVQVVYTVPEPFESWQATQDFLQQLEVLVLPWEQARQMEFDVVLAASTRGIDDVTGSVLLIPHGGGFAQYRPWRPPAAGENWRPVLGLEPDQLMRDGTVRADAIVLTHPFELGVLRRVCPTAVPRAVVVGNIAYDRLAASVGFRPHYRRALGVPDDRKLVVVCSTWSERSAFGRHPDLFERALNGLPREDYQVVGLLHPQIWSQHSRGQVRAWLADCLDAGLVLVPPEGDWRAALVAADFFVGDYGSVTTFAAGIGLPILLTPGESVPLLDGSPAALLSELAPRWDFSRPLMPQLGVGHAPHAYSEVASRLTTRPGHAGVILRRKIYRMLRLQEPARAVPVSPAPLPVPITR
jgi:hypothetical protein